ncbi:DUF3343 domain-containing protein [Desulfuribacillus alkaliarsenatis]|uniref:Putative Se/S carrier protein-like domain-containing protein n=1 Tax=Desulfuribacillus alkaliarsenatis TaxID=766136 RepID=A0A1E5G2Y3_9FIRM|nr:DUF3343 domain-containing protein [Desulfuribacillus alkaliarsenatis]OEF97330.1 hypothetical protein BHF68_03710 [Desulfuribacillus alkaliarsenatis]
MNRNYNRLLTFDSTHQALQLETILDTMDIDFDIRPIPPALYAGCGLAIEFKSEDIDTVKQAITEHQVVSKSFYKKVDKQYIEL